jgi:hypothetical protein
MISDVEASRLNAEIGRLAGGPGGNVAATEVEVSVKVKF